MQANSKSRIQAHTLEKNGVLFPSSILTRESPGQAKFDKTIVAAINPYYFAMGKFQKGNG